MNQLFFSNDNINMLVKIINNQVYSKYNKYVNDLEEKHMEVINQLIQNEMNKLLINNKNLIKNTDNTTLLNFNKKTLDICIPQIFNYIDNIPKNNITQQNTIVQQNNISTNLDKTTDSDYTNYLSNRNNIKVSNNIEEEYSKILNNNSEIINNIDNILPNNNNSEIINNIDNRLHNNNNSEIINNIDNILPNINNNVQTLNNDNILDDNNIESEYSKIIIERNELTNINYDNKNDKIEQIKDKPIENLSNNYEELLNDRNKGINKHTIINELIINSYNRDWINDNIYSFNQNLNLTLLKSIELQYVTFPKLNLINELDKLNYEEIFNYPYLLLKINQLNHNILINNNKIYSKLVLDKEDNHYKYYHNENNIITNINNINEFNIELLKPNGEKINCIDTYKTNNIEIKKNECILELDNVNNLSKYDKIKIKNVEEIEIKEYLENNEHRVLNIDNNNITIYIPNNYKNKKINTKMDILNINIQISIHFNLTLFY